MAVKCQMSNVKCFSTGFTLLETLIAMLILSAAIVGPLSIAQKSLSSAIYAHNQITAFHLAGEAMEYVRNIRDENNLANRSWLSGISSSCSTANPCGLDPTNPNPLGRVVSCSSTDGCRLSFDPNLGIYSHRTGGNWKNSIFSRSVVISENIGGNPDEAVVRITLSWTTAGVAPKSFVIQEHLFNWRGDI